ncbi:hypothetical protein E1B28_001210 [Marasmius oreades]|uniref:Uncharacterized protein n=1 Tax=Marasmius oreades TaxID=181124 RepID=A0A9P7V2X2_9AGAR|nr:uncharacterized protein E1B28_001210 [Marasmius oreades]KAG7099354.1 hypothetical protein E1B28_001210 [Marasmius oreades]
MASSCCSNEVIVHLQSEILIPDYSRYYNTPISDFKGPSYQPLEDGSLVTAAFIEDLRNANITFTVLVMLAVIFLHNSFVSANYIRRARIRQKTLFYQLHFSQLLGCVGTFPQIVSFFQREPNCSAVILIAGIASPLSLTFLMTGILGFKAYKCLEDSILVAVVLCVLLTGYMVATVLDIIHTRGVQKLSGSCARIVDIRFTRMTFVFEFVQSLFLCCCFFFAVWKSRGSPIYRTRISKRLSFEEPGNQIQRASVADGPVASKEYVYISSHSDGSLISFSISHIFSRLRKAFSGFVYKGRPTSATSERLLSNTYPTNGATRLSLMPSLSSRISRYVPRMQLLHNVMKDELCYTLAITLTYVVSTVLVVIGINFQSSLPIVGWIGLNWVIMSVLAMHSFGRVIRRRETETSIQRVLFEGGWHNNGSIGHLHIRRARESDTSCLEAHYRDNTERQSFGRTSKDSSVMESNMSPATPVDTFDFPIPLNISSPIAVPPLARKPYTSFTTPP